MDDHSSSADYHSSPNGPMSNINRPSNSTSESVHLAPSTRDSDNVPPSPPSSASTSVDLSGGDGYVATHSNTGRLSGLFSSFTSRLPPALTSFELPSSSQTDDYFAAQLRRAQTTNLHKVLGWKELISLGIGCTIGSGIFVTTGIVAATKSGPALFLSYIVAGIACCLAGLCYAELAAMSPSSGSAYSYARASLGQTMGWIIGWDLTLEYAVSAASVAQGWSKYFNALLELMGVSVPKLIRQSPFGYDADSGTLFTTGSLFDFPAFVVTIAITILLIKGMRESAKFASAMVILKIAIVMFVILVGLFYMDSSNFSPFMPYGFLGISFFGHTAVGQTGPDGSPVGVFAGSAIVFFAYIGFDTVTCQAEETKNPQRDLPIGIIGSLAISTFLYVAISIVLVGMVPYQLIDLDAPISDAFGQHGLHWAEFIIALGAIVGITSVLLVTLLGQPRILMSMARDGLLPPFFEAVHPVYGTPYKSTALTGIIVAFIASLVPLSILVELVSIGTLLAFTIVCVSIILLRRAAPNVPRPFLCPYVPWVPACGGFICFMLMISLPSANWIRLIVWLGIGMVIYVFYGYDNSKRIQAERQLTAGQRESAIEMGVTDSLGPLPVDSNEVSFGANEYELQSNDLSLDASEPNPFENVDHSNLVVDSNDTDTLLAETAASEL